MGHFLMVSYSIKNNSIEATRFKAIKAPPGQNEREENETDKGLRVADKGYLNTAVIRSGITYINGEAGSSLKLLTFFNFGTAMLTSF